MTIEKFDPRQANINVTDKALKHFTRSLANKPNHLIRLSVKESGCTGFAYVLDFVTQAEADDQLISLSEQIKLAVSPMAVEVANGTEIDYVVEGVNGIVKFNNPNVTAECGCGESFAV